MTEQAVKVPKLMFRVLFGCVTKSPLHFTDIHGCIPPCSVSVTFASEESQGLGPSPLGFFDSSVPVWTAFPHPLARVRIPAASDYYAPSDSFKGNRSGSENLTLAIQSPHSIPCRHGN